ncbi:MAG TPA: hypothetical protein DEG43_17100 [Acidimicrobiaceae bacterium]|jgi:DNA-binding transcriptional ArsR family regulator|nr:hypothetical protein [Acidimicrobiaceae bacterium]
MSGLNIDSSDFVDRLKSTDRWQRSAVTAAELQLDDNAGDARLVVVVGPRARHIAELVKAMTTSCAVPIVSAESLPIFAQSGSWVFVTRSDEKTAEVVRRCAKRGIPLTTLGLSQDAIDQHLEVVGAAIVATTLLSRVGLVEDVSESLPDALHELREGVEELEARAVAAAAEVAQTIPVICGSGVRGATIAGRMKRSLNLFAKIPAFASSLEDVVSAEAAGWGQHGDITRQIISAWFIRQSLESAQADSQFKQLDEIYPEIVSGIHTVSASSAGGVIEVLELVLLVDLIAAHVALRSTVDPGFAPILDSLSE